MAGSIGRRSTLASLLGNVLVQIVFLVLSMGTGVITARLLGPEGRGIFAAVTALPTFLAGFATIGFGAVIVLIRKFDNDQDRGQIAASAVVFSQVASAALAVAGVFLMPYSMPGYPAESILCGQVMLIGIHALALQLVFRNVFAGFGSYQRLNAITLLPQLAYLLLLAGWALVGQLDAHKAAYLSMASNWIAVVLLTPWFIAAGRPNCRKGFRTRLREFRTFVHRSVGQDVVVVISQTVDRLLLIPFVPPAELGLYTVSVGFARLVAVIHPAIHTILLSTMSAIKAGDELKALHDRAFRFALVGLAFVSFGVVAMDRTLLGWLYGTDFEAAAPILRVLVAESAISCLVAISSQTFMAWNRPGLVSVTYFVSLVVFVALALLLIPQHGAMGAAIALLAAGVFRLITLISAFPVVLKQPLPRMLLDKDDIVELGDRLRRLIKR